MKFKFLHGHTQWLSDIKRNEIVESSLSTQLWMLAIHCNSQNFQSFGANNSCKKKIKYVNDV